MYYPPPLLVVSSSLPIPFPALRRSSSLPIPFPALHRSSSPASLLLHCRSSSASAPPPWVRTRNRISTMAAVDDDFFTADLDPDEYPESDDDDSPSPWEGALVYRRDAAVHHLEYATTLERLGLGDLSSPDSRARAAAMGILSSTKADQTETPVLVSVDVTRRRSRLRLDGIVRTVITLGCFRCAEPAPEGIFANFSLLLTDDPVEEPDVIDLGTIYEEVEGGGPSSVSGTLDEEDDQDIDWDDRLHFPDGDKEIDISKHIRDVIHLEITFDAFCSPTCKGLCLVCGTNLNTSSCSCNSQRQPQDVKRRGPLNELLRPLQQR